MPTIVWIALAALVVLESWPTMRAWTHPELVTWRTDYAAARQDAMTMHRPVLIDFYAAWCGPCQAMIQDTWSDQAVADAVKNYTSIRVDIDKDPATAEGFGIGTIPTMVILDAAGNPMKAHTGYLGPAELLAWLASAPDLAAPQPATAPATMQAPTSPTTTIR